MRREEVKLKMGTSNCEMEVKAKTMPAGRSAGIYKGSCDEHAYL